MNRIMPKEPLEQSIPLKTYNVDCLKIATVDSHNPKSD